MQYWAAGKIRLKNKFSFPNRIMIADENSAYFDKAIVWGKYLCYDTKTHIRPIRHTEDSLLKRKARAI